MKKYTLIKTIVLSAALSGNVLADLNDGLMAYYPFNGDAKDESGNKNDGTVNGATLAEDRFGKKNSAYQFRDDVIDIGNNIINGNSLTISSWIKASSLTTGSWHDILAGDCGTLLFGLSHQKLYFGGQCNNPMTTVHSNLSLADDNWHHVVGTYDGNSLTIYINGSQEASEDKNGIFNAALPLGIGGALGHVKGESFLGAIDDVRIYNRALSESEIQQLYTAEQEEEENEQPPTKISSKAIYDSSINTLSLEGILVPFIDGFTGKATDKKGIFDVHTREKAKLVFQVIPWSINIKGTLEGENTSSYILYHHKTRSVDIPCFEVTTIAKLGSGIEGECDPLTANNNNNKKVYKLLA